MLGAGCITGALAGVYGQFVIDAYLRHVTGFPVTGAGAGARPIETWRWCSPPRSRPWHARVDGLARVACARAGGGVGRG